MAEHKNTFIKSRMNKDLDARILPRGEYRNATNVSISKSEDEGVGSLETIKGNELLQKATTEANNYQPLGPYSDQKVIGSYVDVSTDKVYLFLTRYLDGSSDTLSNFSLDTVQSPNVGFELHWIVCVEIKETGTTLNVLCTGAFLNFSQTHPVLGINVIENLLFWTDNRNQPRKLNINKALSNPNYYDSEDKISLAKYYPYQPISFLENKKGFPDTSLKNITQKWLPCTNAPLITFPANTGGISKFRFEQNGDDYYGFQCYTFYDYYEVAQWYLSGTPKVAGGSGDSNNPPSSFTGTYTGFPFPGDKFESTLNTEGGVYAEGSRWRDSMVRDFLPAPVGWDDGEIKQSAIWYETTPGTWTSGTGWGGYGTKPYNKYNSGGIFGGNAATTPNASAFCEFQWDTRDVARQQLVTTDTNMDGATVEWDNPCRLLQAVPIKLGWDYGSGSANSTSPFSQWDGANSQAPGSSNFGFTFSIPGSDDYNANGLNPGGGRVWLWSISIYAKATSTGGIPNSLSQMRAICAGETGSNARANGPLSLKPKLFFHYPNPNYVEGFEDSPVKIDESYLKEKFVRFSYRFKFEDDEYSLIAPFTQTAFIPEQYGHFMNSDETKARKSLDVNFMQNYVNQATLKIPLPCPANELKSKFLVDEIEILYKESDEVAIKYIDTLKTSEMVSGDTSVDFIYNSQEPSKVLPEQENVRVFDKTPVRALTQESVGNRIIFGNFVDKPKAPSTLRYQLSFSGKSFANEGSGREYPMHTVKHNRTYQVGVILSDRYGRQSDVITSIYDKVLSPTNPAPGSTIYVPYKDALEANNIISWFGDAIRFKLLNYIPTSISGEPDYPGIYSSTNPLGWYSYKIVVKQQEQDYYNIYVPGVQSRIMYKKGWSKFDINPLSYRYQSGVPGYQYYFTDTSTDGSNENSWSGRLQNMTTTEDMDSNKSMWGFPFYNSWTGAMATVRTLDLVDFLYKSDNPKYQIEVSGDNINKLPRSLINVGPNDKDFAGSDVGLFCRVSPKQWNRSFQFFPKGDYPKSDKVEQIREFNTFNVEPSDTIPIYAPGLYQYGGYGGTQTPADVDPSGSYGYSYNDEPWYGYFRQNGFLICSKGWADDANNPLEGLVDTSVDEVYHVENVALYDFYNSGNELRKENSLLIASVDASSANAAGYIVGPEMDYNGKNSRWTRLGVFETTPVKSKLEVFWETTSTGLISTINNALQAAGGPDFVDTFYAEDSPLVSDVTAPQLNIISAGNKYLDNSEQANAYSNAGLTWNANSWLNDDIQLQGEFVIGSTSNSTNSLPLFSTNNYSGVVGNIQTNYFGFWPSDPANPYYVPFAPALSGTNSLAYAGEVVSLTETRLNGQVVPTSAPVVNISSDSVIDGLQYYSASAVNTGITGFNVYPFKGGDVLDLDFNCTPITNSDFTYTTTVKNVAPMLGLLWYKNNNVGADDAGVSLLSKVNPSYLSNALSSLFPSNIWSNRYLNETTQRDTDGDCVVWASGFSNTTGKAEMSGTDVVEPVALLSLEDAFQSVVGYGSLSGWPGQGSGTSFSNVPTTRRNGQAVNNGNNIWFSNGNYTDLTDECTVSITSVYFAGFNQSNLVNIYGNNAPSGAMSFGDASSGWLQSDNSWSQGMQGNGVTWINVTSDNKFQIKRITTGDFKGGFYIATKDFASWTEIPNARVYWEPGQSNPPTAGQWMSANADPKVNYTRSIAQDGSLDYGGVGINGNNATNTSFIGPDTGGGGSGNRGWVNGNEYNYKINFKITDVNGAESPEYQVKIAVGGGTGPGSGGGGSATG